jgi:hypothetical protein
MPRFKINCSWREYHSGELIVKAKNEDAAVDCCKEIRIDY